MAGVGGWGDSTQLQEVLTNQLHDDDDADNDDEDNDDDDENIEDDRR